MLTKVIKLLIPPIVPIMLSKIRAMFLRDALFGGDDQLFKDLLDGVEIYGEYGCGASTNWVLKNTKAKVIAVDTSEVWVATVRSDHGQFEDRLNIRFVNLGTVGEWGRPRDYALRDRFEEYTDHLWYQAEKPQLVLVDGRFRVCCFLTCLKYANEGTRIIFDDYTNRPFYHVVEKYVERRAECGRQCLFVIPSKDQIDMNALDQDISAFRLVMD